MKLNHIFKATLASLFFPQTLVAATEETKKSAPVHIYHEIIEISALEYAELVTHASSAKDHTTFREKLIEQIKQGTAKLILNDSLIVQSGNKGTLISAQELIYETELDVESHKMKYIKNNASDPSTTLPHYFTTPPTPIAFESRRVGDILHATPSLKQNSQLIKLFYESEHTRHKSNDIYMNWTTEVAKTEQYHPVFYTTRTHTELNLQNGKFTLIASYSPDPKVAAKSTKKWLCFMKVSILAGT